VSEIEVVYDGRMLSYPFTGLGRYSAELLLSLLSVSAGKIHYTVILYKNETTNKVYIERLQKYQDLGICNIVFSKSHPVSILQHIKLSWLVNKLKADIYFHPHFDLPLFIKTPSVTVVHDLFPLIVPDYIQYFSTVKKIYFSFMLKFLSRKALYIYAVSNTTKSDLIDFIGERFAGKVGVTLEGPIVNNNYKEETLLINEIKPGFLLYTGDRRPHKNLKRIIDLFILLKDQNKYHGNLILVGSKTNFDFDVDTYIENRKDIKTPGNVTDAELLFLYKKMDSLIFLSKYEGFGLPVLEAAILKKKIIVSDGGALKEIAPSWSFTIPTSAILEDVVDSVASYLSSPVCTDADYGGNYKWQVIGQSVSKKLITLVG